MELEGNRMKISELIEELERLKDEHGDLEVRVLDTDEYEYVEIYNDNLEKLSHHDFVSISP
jgi:PP-loop superfamily ATP-utilizing enzyme